MVQSKLALILLVFAVSTWAPHTTQSVNAAPAIQQAIGTTNEAVLVVRFPDLALEGGNYVAALNGQVAYYTDASFGRFTVSYNVFGPFTLPQNEIFYGRDVGGDFDENKEELVRDSIQAADASVNFNNYQHVTIVHAGSGQESSQTANDIYSSWIRFLPAEVTNDGAQISKAVIVSEHSPRGTFAHEFGHDLGLPDLYNPNTGSTDNYVGLWSLMASGNWLGTPPGSSPADFDSWSMSQLGWITPVTISNASATVTIGPLELANQPVYAVKIPLSSTSYYLVDARRRLGVDTSIPSEGVLVYLVDESRRDSNGFVAGVLLVQPHPNPDLNSATLQPGDSFADPQGRVFIRVVGQVGQGYSIQITSHMLLLTLNGPLQVSATETVPYSIHVTDEDGNPKSGILVTVTLDGRTLRQVTTDSLGNAAFQIAFNWTDIGLHTFIVETQSLTDYINGSQTAYLQVTVPPSLYPVIAAAIIIPVGLVLVMRRNKSQDFPPPSQWTPAQSYSMPVGYCPQCGQARLQGYTYCMYCGTKFT